MKNIEQKLEILIEEAINCNNIAEVTQFTSALAALRSAEAQTRNADNIEKILAVLAGLGETIKKAAGQFDPVALAKMAEQEKGTQ